MTGSVALDVVIGLVFIYLLYSLLASLIQEIIATNLSFRAKILEKAIGRLLDDDSLPASKWSVRFSTWMRLLTPFKNFSLLKKSGLSSAFYNHPEIKYLAEDSWNSRPSYLSATNFSKVLIDLLRGTGLRPGDGFRDKIQKSLDDGKFTEFNASTLSSDSNKPETATKNNKIDPMTLNLINSIWIDAHGDIEEFKRLLEKWFNDMMDRTTGWYKKYNQIVLLFVGLTIAVVFNVDTIMIVKKLSKDPELRSAMVNQVDTYLKAHPNLEDNLKKKIEINAKLEGTDTVKMDSLNKLAMVNYDSLIERRDSLITATRQLIESDIKNVNDLMGLGWKKGACGHKDKKCSCWCLPERKGENSLFGSVVGWILTALALSMGAPFWFDLLNKLMKLRGSVQSSTVEKVQSPNSKKSDENKVKTVG